MTITIYLSSCLLLSIPAVSQKAPVDLWFNLGAGANYVMDEEYPGIGPAIRFGAAMQFGRFNISTRITGNTSAKSPYLGPSLRELRNQYLESGLLLGLNTSPTGNYWIIPSAGIGVLFGNTVFADSASLEDGHYEPFKPIVALPLELAIVGNNKLPGFGLYLHANVNGRGSLFGITLVFAFGTIQRPPE